MSKYISLEYLTQNNPKPDGVQYKGVFGNRSIGKTHGVLKYLLKNQRNNEAVMILRRNKLELNFKPFVQKYAAAFERDWEIEGQSIVEDHDKIVMYYHALSLCERGKHDNFDAPYVTDIIVDEVYAENPNKNEFQQLQTWITTLSRRTFHPFHPVTVWLLGNYDYGHSPILDNLGVFPANGRKQKTDNGVYLFSDMPSPENSINVRSPLIREFTVAPENEPIMSWNYMRQSFAMYDMGMHLYICNTDSAKDPYTMETQKRILKYGVRKIGIPRVYVQNYECLRFIDNPALRYTL